MAVRIMATAGKFAYGAAFLLCLPALLLLWARGTADLFQSPAYRDPVGGAILCIGGLALMVWGMAALWMRGGGLPMNAFPPPRLVTTGPYALLPHPIYAGAGLLCLGLSISTGSASGLLLVSPALILGSVALVLGYEGPDLQRRFGQSEQSRYRMLPVDDLQKPRWADRIAFYLGVLLPWLAAYGFIHALGVQPGSLAIKLPFEDRLPIIEWAEYVYASTYIVVFAAPLVAASRHDLRRLWIQAWTAMIVVFPVYVLMPTITLRRPFAPTTWAGLVLDWERNTDTPSAAFPSFHVLWSLFAAEACASRTPRLRWVWRTWVLAVAIACVLTGMHYVADIVAAFAIGIALLNVDALWRVLRRASEQIANSWKEWHIGPVRVINHGFYAGGGTFIAYSIIGAAAGPGNELAVAFTAISALVGAAMWAQWIEGSPRLLRPYGFYGGLAGATIASLIAGPLLGVSAWLLMAAHCLAAPWLQSIGRLRCLVQGCCHGRPASEEVGIRYTHPMSRVTRVTGLARLPLHPTPLYSILWNVPVALVLIRLWTAGAALHLIGGVYLILSGVGRFVEEAYRGEPQTPVFAGLRLYQWIAVATVVAGAFITAVPHTGTAPALHLGWPAVANAFALGLIATVALGVDFPSSQRRFARLT